MSGRGSCVSSPRAEGAPAPGVSAGRRRVGLSLCARSLCGDPSRARGALCAWLPCVLTTDQSPAARGCPAPCPCCPRSRAHQGSLPCLGICQDPSSCPAPRASRVSHQETVGCRFRAGLGDTAASSRIHLPRFGAWPGPDLTGGQAGHLATPSHPPSSSGRFWAGAGTPDEHTRERGWGQYSAGSWIQSLN